ncbi:MAG: DNA cytosine methyltransferase [Methanosarcina mazei]
MKDGIPVAVDLFCGAGGLTEGLKNAGFLVVSAVEKDSAASETYAENHPNVNLIKNDIRKLDTTSILKGTGVSRRAVDLLAGGPPCQGFSVSNMKTRNMENPNNQLIYEFLRIVKEMNPKWVLLENVAGLKLFKKGVVVEELIKCFNILGYKMEPVVLNAVNFGVPQNRERVFFIGTRTKSRINFIEKLRNTIIETPLTVEEAISDLPELENGNSICEIKYIKPPQNKYQRNMREKVDLNVRNNLVSRNSPLILERYRYINQGENWRAVLERRPDLMANYGDPSRCHSGIYRRLLEDKPSIVISNYRKNMLIHPRQDRGLSVREAARLQSFPDHYLFKGPLSLQQQQVANAVPPLLGESVAREIIKML